MVFSSIYLSSISTIAFAMTASDLAKFIVNNKPTFVEPEIYTYYDNGCLRRIPVRLLKTINLGGNRIGGITNLTACWGAKITYFEMTRDNLESVSAFSAIGSGRSLHYSNWGPDNRPGENITLEELQAIGKAMSLDIKIQEKMTPISYSNCQTALIAARDRMKGSDRYINRTVTDDISKTRSDYPKGRFQSYGFSLGGSRAVDLMNSPKLLTDITQNIIQKCTTVSMVEFGLDATDFNRVYGILSNGSIGEFKCIDHDERNTQKLPWGVSVCL